MNELYSEYIFKENSIGFVDEFGLRERVTKMTLVSTGTMELPFPETKKTNGKL